MTITNHVCQAPANRCLRVDAGITYPLNRHFAPSALNSHDTSLPFMTAVASVDWYEIGGVVLWKRGTFPELERAFREAQQTRKPVSLQVGKYSVLVQPEGWGKKRESYMRYKIIWENIVVGVSERHASNRQLYNFYLWASGHACVVLGLEAILEFQHSLIKSLGGRLDDSWIKRIDVCLDISGRSVIDELIQKLRDGCFVTSSRDQKGENSPIKIYDQGFAIPTEGIRLTAYDKIAEMKKEERGNDYWQAMIQNRWGGVLPTYATRVEFQVRKGRLFELGMKTAPDVLNRLNEVVAHVTSEASRSFFRFTATPPDLKNGHHSRAKTLPLWKEIIECLQRGFQPLSQRQMRRIRGRRTTTAT